jgi:phosphonate degradation associated HDIG domain protein
MPYDEIYSLFTQHGDSEYFGEPVSQSEHALQAAKMAADEGVPSSLIAAALLHDIGHLLHGRGEDIADQGIDSGHEEAGGAWLARWFGPDVTEPVRLHVPAKRYLCAIDPAYLEGLSPASTQSLRLQGGPFTPEEVREFELHPHFSAAVQLRRWDDAAKIPGLVVPELDTYRDVIEGAISPRDQSNI